MFSPRNDKKTINKCEKMTLGKWKQKFRSQKKWFFSKIKFQDISGLSSSCDFFSLNNIVVQSTGAATS